MKNFTFSVDAHDTSKGTMEEYTQDSEYMRFQWYRRNPYNYDMTAIAGATKLTYTPTLDDVGYELVLEISGDRDHCGFIFRKLLSGVYNGIVSVPVALLSMFANWAVTSFPVLSKILNSVTAFTAFSPSPGTTFVTVPSAVAVQV